MALKIEPGLVVPVRVKWRRVIAVCRKCSRKLDGGFGPQGDLALRKALRREAGRHVKVIDVKCLGICPRGGVSLLDSERPGQVLVAAPGADLVHDVIETGSSRPDQDG